MHYADELNLMVLDHYDGNMGLSRSNTDHYDKT